MKFHVLAKIVPFLCLTLFAAIFGGQMLIYQHAEAQVRLGIASYQQGSYSKAESQMRRALRLNPNNAYASYYLGLCLLHGGKLGEAKQQFETAQTIAHGSKFVTRNEPLEEDASAALDRLGQPAQSH